MIIRMGKESTLRKYLQHATQSELTQRDDVQSRMAYLPTCPKCERIAFRDRRKYDPIGEVYVTCPICGYHGPPGPPFGLYVREV